MRIELNRNEIEPKRGETQCRFIDVEPRDLFVENRAERLRVGATSVLPPAFCDELAKCSEQADARSDCGLEHARGIWRTFPAERRECRLGRETRNLPRPIIAALSILTLSVVP